MTGDSMASDRQIVLPAVFVVDDEVAIQHCLKALLSVWGIPVHTFSSAEAFLESYSHDWTGCLFVDLRMPGTGGLGLLKELRQRGSSLPALLITGHGQWEVQQQAIEYGAVGVLEKPFRVEVLKEHMERHCPEFFAATHRPATPSRRSDDDAAKTAASRNKSH